ncbi:MAG: efflux RND transporter periplasmic adaptor subunit [Limnohabitans sp.]
MSTEQAQPNPLLILIQLGKEARSASTLDELGFMLVNDSRVLSGYRQALLWSADQGVTHLSGVVIPERHSPFIQWAGKLCDHLSGKTDLSFKTLSVLDLPEVLQQGWGQWMPKQVWWIPLEFGGQPSGLLVADDALDEQWLPLWREWTGVWSLAADRLSRAESSSVMGAVKRWFRYQRQGSAWRNSRLWWVVVGVVLALLFPVRMTVVGQGELVPREPVVVRAPLDGVIHEFHVSPNQVVKAGDALFSYDNEVIRSRLQVAQQSLATAQAEYRQTAQSALSDARAKFQIASLVGKVQEKQAELKFLTEQVGRTTVTAPQAGMVLFDEVSEWIGKPVQTGERVVRMADPANVELEVWVNLADAVPLKSGDEAKLFLAASPLDVIEAKVRWVGYEAQPRPDGTFAYRVRASLSEQSAFMVGAKGTARVSSSRVPLAYWLLRKPLAVIRGYLLM